jgi:hypothetical protein
LCFEFARPALDPLEVGLAEAAGGPTAHQQYSPFPDRLHHHRWQAWKQGFKLRPARVVTKIHQGDGALALQRLLTNRARGEAPVRQQSPTQDNPLTIVQQQGGGGRGREQHGAAPAQFLEEVIGQPSRQLAPLFPGKLSPLGRKRHHPLPKGSHHHQPDG